MVSFCCSNTSLEGDFKKTKTYQNMREQQVVRPLLLYLEKLTVNLPYKIYGQFLVW